MTAVSETYGESCAGSRRRRACGRCGCCVSWVVAAAAIWVAAAAACPGSALDQTGAAFARRRGDRDPQRGAAAGARGAAPAVHARRRLPARPGRRRARAACSRDDVVPDDIRVDGFGDALLAALVIAAVSMVLQAVLGTNDDDEYTLRVTRRIARRQGARATDRRAGHRLPRDRRARAAGAARRDARRQRADDGALDRRGRLPARRVGDRPLVADRRQPGRASCSARTRTSRRSAGSRRRRGLHDGLLVAGRLRRDRAAPRTGDGTARRRRREPRQPALGRGGGDDPHREPHRTPRSGANPGYRAFFANGFNVTRALVLFFWEVALEVTAAARAPSAATCGRAGTAAASIR